MAAALTLSVFTLRARAYVETLADNTRVLTSPWTDADHSEACPASDPRICPVLALDNPAIIVRTKDSRINLRSVATLSAAERAAGPRNRRVEQPGVIGLGGRRTAGNQPVFGIRSVRTAALSTRRECIR